MFAKYLILNIIFYFFMISVFHFGTGYAGDAFAVDGRIIAHDSQETMDISLKKHPQNLNKTGLKAAKKRASTYQLGAGDTIKVFVLGEENLSQIYLVNEEGYISVPLVGDIFVGNLTVSEVKELLYSKFSEGYLRDPSISIEIAEFRPFYIMGEVRQPGSYEYSADLTVLNAVAIAGGFTYRANRKKIEILRRQGETSVLHDDISTDSDLLPGDIILVKERFF